jgi:hypothetical protein
MGIDQYTLIRECDATYKVGIMFRDWAPEPYMHSVQVPYDSRASQYKYVYAKQTGNNYYTRAIVTDINAGIYTIQFDNGTIETTTINNLMLYYPCNCDSNLDGIISINETSSSNPINCNIPTGELISNFSVL